MGWLFELQSMRVMGSFPRWDGSILGWHLFFLFPLLWWNLRCSPTYKTASHVRSALAHSKDQTLKSTFRKGLDKLLASFSEKESSLAHTQRFQPLQRRQKHAVCSLRLIRWRYLSLNTLPSWVLAQLYRTAKPLQWSLKLSFCRADWKQESSLAGSRC